MTASGAAAHRTIVAVDLECQLGSYPIIRTEPPTLRSVCLLYELPSASAVVPCSLPHWIFTQSCRSKSHCRISQELYSSFLSCSAAVAGRLSMPGWDGPGCGGTGNMHMSREQANRLGHQGSDRCLPWLAALGSWCLTNHVAPHFGANAQHSLAVADCDWPVRWLAANSLHRLVR